MRWIPFDERISRSLVQAAALAACGQLSRPRLAPRSASAFAFAFAGLPPAASTPLRFRDIKLRCCSGICRCIWSMHLVHVRFCQGQISCATPPQRDSIAAMRCYSGLSHLPALSAAAPLSVELCVLA